MKILTVILSILIGISAITAKQPTEQLTVRNGGQAVTKNGRITVKFVELVDDSRCPEDVNCAWAGIARIKIRLSKNGRNSIVELNTNQSERAVMFQGYSIALRSLTPHPSTTAKYSPSAYRAVLAVSRPKR